MHPSHMDLLGLPPLETHPCRVLPELPGGGESGRYPGHQPWVQPASTASLSQVIKNVLFIQKSTISNSIKLQTNEEGGKD